MIYYVDFEWVFLLREVILRDPRITISDTKMHLMEFK